MQPVRKPCFYKISDVPLKVARNLYHWQKSTAAGRGVPFLFTFSEWLIVWEISGKMDDRGKLKGQYVMARKGDAGPYAWWNVDIILAEENVRQAHLGRKHSEKTKRRKRVWAWKNTKSKLTDAQILDIRATYKPGGRGHSEQSSSAQVLARKYGVHESTIRNIVHGRLPVHKRSLDLQNSGRMI